jgi:hypothetical protein
VSTTEPINGDNFDAVADNLIMESGEPTNSDDVTEETLAAIVDEQPVEDDEVAEDQDDVEASSDDELEFDDDVEDIENEEPEVQVEADTFTVKVDGVERTVSLDELKRGYSGQEYIQKGMAENAEARKAVEELIQTTNQERQQLQQMMQQLQQDGVPPIPEYPSEELRDSDPIGFLEAEAEYRRAMDRRVQYERQAQQLAQRDQQVSAERQQQRMESEMARLAEWMPEFGDPEKRNSLMMDITSKAKKHYNLSDEMLSTVETAEEVAILRDALRYREAVARRDNAKAKVANKPPVAKPSAKKSMQTDKARQAKQAKANMRNNGGVDDVAKFLLS